MRREYAQKGLSPPSEETARRQYLWPGVACPDLATVKDFIRFYIATSNPRLDERPTVDSVNIVAEWFFAGFTRVTGTDTVEEERSEVYNWVRRTLTLEGIVVNKHRPKHNFTVRDLTRVLLALWTQDDLIFIPGAISSPDHLHYTCVLLDRGPNRCILHQWPPVQGHRAYLTACERPKLEAHLQDRLAVGEK